MKNRVAVSKRIFEAMTAYNIYQTCLNFWLFFSFVSELLRNPKMSILGNEQDHTHEGYYLGLLIWIQYNNKYALPSDSTHHG